MTNDLTRDLHRKKDNATNSINLHHNPSSPCTSKATPIIAVKNLTLQINGKVIFGNLNINLPKDSITTIIGPSGSGKTSFLSSLNRLVDMVPKSHLSGTINYASTNLVDKETDLIKLRREVGMIFQKPNPFPMSIWKNIEIPLREHGNRDKVQLEQIIENTLKDVGLWNEIKDRLKQSALSLSGGQQQRLCIARALALKPKVLLMDEPCSALDPIASGRIEHLIKKLRTQYTFIVVTHNLPQAKRIGDFTALFWVKDGRGCLIEQGTTDQIFGAPKHRITNAYINGIYG